MPDAKLLLSSRERKALFRASQLALDSSFQKPREFADDLCDKLDDGGIWNPCFILLSDRRRDSDTNTAFCFIMIVKWGTKHLPEHSHTLEMIYERYQYCEQRSVNKKKQNRAPFLTRSDYYGPNWDSKREEAITRDGGCCTECGMAREEHRDRYDQDLHVHHIVPIREIGDYTKANRLDNLTTLCFKCHQLVEQP